MFIHAVEIRQNIWINLLSCSKIAQHFANVLSSDPEFCLYWYLYGGWFHSISQLCASPRCVVEVSEVWVMLTPTTDSAKRMNPSQGELNPRNPFSYY